MLFIHMNVFFVCTFVIFLSGQLCNSSSTTERTNEQICCNRYELGHIRCIACAIGFYQHVNGNCKQCPATYCGSSCGPCAIGFYQQVNGYCKPCPATYCGSSCGHTNIPEYTYMHVLAVIAFGLFIFSSTCMCYKCKKSCQGTDQTTTTHQNESGYSTPQGETHQYDEVDDGFLNRQSSVNDGHDVRSSGSSSGGSGICGIDSDGYLNPYHALNSIEITIGQGASSEQSSTETSYVQAQENSVDFQTSE